MSKILKRLTTIALAAVMLIGTMTTAFAEEKLNNGIDVNNTKTGSITIHKYKMPDAEDALPDNTDIGGIEVEKLPESAEPLAGVGFQIIKMAQTETGEWVETMVLPDTVVTDVNGEATVSNLSLGRYKVEELGFVNGDGSEATLPNSSDEAMVGRAFYVDVPMTKADGQTLNYDVHVYPKNEVLSVDEYVTSVENKHDSFNMKQEQTWIVQATIPGNIALSNETSEERGIYNLAQTYEMSTTFDKGLTYVQDGVTVSLVNKDGEKLRDLKTEEYEAHFIAWAGGDPTEENGGTLKVSLTETGKINLKKAIDDPDQKVAFLEIRYNTYMNEKAALGTPIYNQANLTFIGATVTREAAASVTVTVPENERPEVHTGRTAIKKIAGDTKEALEGVEFMIFDTSDKATAAVKLLQEKEAGKIEGALEVYDRNANEGKGGFTTVVTSNEAGIADFTGLAYRNEDGKVTGAENGATTYYIVETKTAKGYQLPSKYFEVTVSHDSTIAETPDDTIVNVKPSKLPAAGGKGTIIFTAVGLGIMAAAGIIVLKSRKKKEQ